MLCHFLNHVFSQGLRGCWPRSYWLVTLHLIVTKALGWHLYFLMTSLIFYSSFPICAPIDTRTTGSSDIVRLHLIPLFKKMPDSLLAVITRILLKISPLFRLLALSSPVFLSLSTLTFIYIYIGDPAKVLCPQFLAIFNSNDPHPPFPFHFSQDSYCYTLGIVIISDIFISKICLLLSLQLLTYTYPKPSSSHSQLFYHLDFQSSDTIIFSFSVTSFLL